MPTELKTAHPFDLEKMGIDVSLIFEELDAAAMIADHNRTVVAANGLASAYFGYDHDALIGMYTRDLYADGADFDSLGKECYNEHAEEGVNDRYVVRYRRKDGTVFDGATVSGVIRSYKTGTNFFFGLISNVTRLSNGERALNRLHSITSSRDLNFEQRVDAILKLGTEHFGLPIGIFSKITDDHYEIRQAVHPENALTPGMSFDLGDTYCSHVIRANDVLGFHHVSNTQIRSHPCYKQFGMEAYLGAPVFVDGELYGTLNFSSPLPTRRFSGQDIELIRLFSTWVGHEVARLRDLRELEKTRMELERFATTDVLTGLYNRRHMEDCLRRELERAKRYNKPLVVSLLDFDNFKKLNDSFGHDAGDAALKLFAKVSSQMMRETDVIARWGGEEFLILMPETGAAGALSYLKRLTDRVRESDFHVGETAVQLTLSAGLAIAEPDDNLDDLIGRADIAMYEAKQAGRDAIRVKMDE